MLFGIYLVENDVLSRADFYEAAKLQLRSRPQLGALAVEECKLNVRDCFTILQVQCDSPGKPFGEIAVDLGLLLPAELNELLVAQTNRVTPFSHILVEHDILPADVVDYHLAEFRRTMYAEPGAGKALAPA